LAAQAVALAEANVEEKNEHAGATETNQTQADVKGKIVEFLWYMQKNGYSKDTIRAYINAIKKLIANNADLTNPEYVKGILAKLQISNMHKHILVAAYTLYLKMNGLKWNPPLYETVRKLPFIPTERELDDLIAAAGRKSGAFLQLLKETALRVGEASRLKWENVDLQRKIIVMNEPEKHGRPRIFNISDKLVNMLNLLPKVNQYVFGTPSKVTRGTVFYKLRKQVASKLGNPRMLNIGFHTFRHWKATMLYHETKDILFVKEFLGHKSIDATLLYVQLEQALFREESNEFHVKATSDPEEIKALLEVGFEYVCSKDGLMFFRKRK
jgi:integrase